MGHKINKINLNEYDDDDGNGNNGTQKDNNYNADNDNKDNDDDNHNDDVKEDNDANLVFSIDIERIKKILNNRTSKFNKIRKDLKNESKKHNKFVINVTGKFDTGFRYYYHKHYKNNTNKTECVPGTTLIDNGNNRYGYNMNEWYIPYKYKNLQYEILNNSIYVLTYSQWQNTLIKATNKWKSYRSNKNIINSASNIFEKVYSIKRGTLITLEHIISILLYTNWSQLSYHFTSTYRKLTNNESNNELKIRNCEYRNWSKLLRESIETYGTYLDESKIASFFCGLSSSMIFDSLSNTISCPLSTANC